MQVDLSSKELALGQSMILTLQDQQVLGGDEDDQDDVLENIDVASNFR